MNRNVCSVERLAVGKMRVDTVDRTLGIIYEAAPELGGLRKPRKDSRNMGWRNTSFRGYADYMETPEFERALNDLIARTRTISTVLMCAEAVPWRCHRSLISDALVVRGIEVYHLMGRSSAIPHRLTSFTVPREGRPTYPAQVSTTTLRGPNGDP
jgi:uncharacterized protein (DUF488 family)